MTLRTTGHRYQFHGVSGTFLYDVCAFLCGTLQASQRCIIRATQSPIIHTSSSTLTINHRSERLLLVSFDADARKPTKCHTHSQLSDANADLGRVDAIGVVAAEVDGKLYVSVCHEGDLCPGGTGGSGQDDRAALSERGWDLDEFKQPQVERVCGNRF